jgi:hypothetical protein
MIRTDYPKSNAVMVGRSAKVKSLEPITSTCAPSSADVVEYSDQKIMLRVKRFMSIGTVVQLHLDGNFSLWKVFCCIETGDTFHLGLELVQLVSRVG